MNYDVYYNHDYMGTVQTSDSDPSPRERAMEKKEPETPDIIGHYIKKVLNYFGLGLDHDKPDDRAQIEQGTKNVEKATATINKVNKFIIVNGALFVLTEGGGALLIRGAGAAIQTIRLTSAETKIITEIAEASDIGKIVLGKHPNYLNVAQKLDAAAFNIRPEIWEAMTTAEQQAKNFEFLDIAIKRGDKIILSDNGFKATGASYDELKYLFSKGYKLADDGMSVIKK